MFKQKNIIFLSLSGLFFLLLLIPDLRISSDTKTYIRIANSIVSFSSLFSTIILEEPQYFMTYIIYKIILIFDNFELTFKLINFVAFIIIIIFSHKILIHFKIKFDNNIDYLFFLLLFFLNFEIIQWTYYGLTDLLMLSFILMATYFFLNGNNFITISIFIFSFLIKPQSIFILFIISFIFINRINYKKYLFFYLYFLFYILIFIFTLLINNLGDNVIILSTFAKYTNWTFLRNLFLGVIIDDRIFIEYENILSIFKIYFLRFINFYSIYFDEFSFKHKLYKIIYFVILYLPIVFYIFKKKLFDKKFIEFSIGCIIIISLFFVLTVIDYDLRYRLYLYPFLIMLSSYCFKKIHDTTK